jgi:SAM-dependent methyltransferase
MIGAMPNEQMTEFWNTRGSDQWVAERDRYDRMLEPCGQRLLRAAALAEGESVLDVGCGNGATTIEAARLVGPSGRAVGIDLSGPMLEVARERALQAGHMAEFLQGDAQIAEFGASLDVVVSRFGVMFFDDPEGAFAHLFGSLRPGGRLSFVCWKPLMENQWLAVPAGAVFSIVGLPEPPPEGAPGPGSFADPARVERILTGAGFVDVELTGASDPVRMGSDVEDVTTFLANDELGRRSLEGRDAQTVERALDAVRTALAPHAGPNGVDLQSAYWVVTARRP